MPPVRNPDCAPLQLADERARGSVLGGGRGCEERDLCKSANTPCTTQSLTRFLHLVGSTKYLGQ